MIKDIQDADSATAFGVPVTRPLSSRDVIKILTDEGALGGLFAQIDSGGIGRNVWIRPGVSAPASPAAAKPEPFSGVEGGVVERWAGWADPNY
jgi:putative transposase